MNGEAKNDNTILKLENVTKRFKGITALDNVHFEARSGEILTLVGENGAGKSTLFNIISGNYQKDSGQIFFKGNEVEIKGVQSAKNLGISMVHQELHLVPEQTVYENIFLGCELLRPKSKVLWFKKMIEKSNSILRELNADFDATRKIKSLTIAQQQLVEIAKAILNDFSVIILDEPTSSLTEKEIVRLFEIMRNFAKQGKAVIFVSHRFEEIFEIADRAIVFRDGKYIATCNIRDTNKTELLKLMTGRDLSKTVKNTNDYNHEEVVLAVENLQSFNNRFRDVSFELHRGEILGFAGLVGCGRTETMRAIFGADRHSSGTIRINGSVANIKNPRDAMKYGIGLIPENRKEQGFIAGMTNMNNVCLSSLNKITHNGILTDHAIKKNAEIFMKMLQVKPLKPNMNTENLSGGNQQKIVIAKWLAHNAQILIMDEPTRGIDVGAKEEIHRLMLELTQNGVSIIMISSELPEVLSISNRVMVMREGKIVGELAAREASEDIILKYAYGQMED